MKKIGLRLTALLMASAFSLAANTAETPVQLFSATEKLIAEAEKQPGTHTQVSKIKNTLNQSKKQILEMELATQIKSCDHGLAKLNKDSTKPEQQEN